MAVWNAASLSVCTIDHDRQNGGLDGDAEQEEDPKEEPVDGLRHTQPLRLYPSVVHLANSLRRVPLERVAIIERLHLNLVHTVSVIPGLDVRQRSLRLVQNEARPIDERRELDHPAWTRLVRVSLAVDVGDGDSHEQSQRDH